MKAKVKLNADGIKHFFVAHGEKLGFAATVIIFLLFVYSTITAKPLDDTKSPEAIKHEAAQVENNIKSSSWTPQRDQMGLKPTNFSNAVKVSMQPISGQHIHPAHEWDPPLFPELIKRADPEIYGVEDVQIAAGSGLVAYKSESAAAAPGTVGPGGPGGPGPGPGGPGGPGFGGPGRPAMGPHGDEDAFHGPGGPGGMFGRGAASRFDQNASITGVRAPGAAPEPKSYVIISGAVPVQKEVEQFKDRFEYAVYPDSDPAHAPLINQTDSPHYFCFLVDRCEVKDAKDATRNWAPILSKANYVNSETLKDLAKWFTQAQDIVHPDDVFQPEPFKDQYFYVTWPLPPLFLKNWGLEAAHPKTKFNSAQEAATENQPDANQAGGNLDAITPDQRGAGVNARLGGGQLGIEHGPMMGVPAIRGPMGPGGPGMGSGMGPGMAMAQSQAESYVDPYKLFRFVDLTAEPGKIYRYRVQLLLYNPNYGLRDGCLDPKAIQAGTAAKKFAESPWVETPAITIPPQVRILADGTNGRLADLKARVNVLAYAKTPAADTGSGASAANPDTWVEVVKDAEVPLGGLVFVHDAEIDKVLDMSAEQVRKVDKINIDTNQTVLLDVRNDKPLGDGKSKDATELLMMDGSGRVFDANHAADKLVLDDYTERTKPPADMSQTTGGETPLPKPREHGRNPNAPGPGGPGGLGPGKVPPGPGGKH